MRKDILLNILRQIPKDGLVKNRLKLYTPLTVTKYLKYAIEYDLVYKYYITYFKFKFQLTEFGKEYIKKHRKV